MESKKIIGIIASILVVGIFLMGIVSATAFKLCMGPRETINYCDNIYGEPIKPPFTCTHDAYCEKCMAFYDPIEDCYIWAKWGDCGSIGGCSYSQNTTYDLEPPTFDLTSPLEGDLFTDRNVLIEFFLDEEATVSYTILSEDNPRELRLCYECDASSGGFPSYSDERIFEEGLNRVMFKAVDLVGNPSYFNVSFFVDSEQPIIKDTSPDQGEYASGEFKVWFNEENPTQLKLIINHQTGEDSYFLNDLGAECVPDRYDTLCTKNINMIKYNGQIVGYQFEIRDIVGNVYLSDEKNITVDSTIPVIHSIEEINDGRYIYFNLTFTEENLESIKYIDLNDPRSMPKDLCRYPLNEVCYGRVSLMDGLHNIQFTVMDEAGNVANQTREVFIDTVVPRIYKTYPKARTFADGTFEVEFKETNPERLTLHYGTDSKNLNLVNDCYEGRGKTYCETNIDLSKYNGNDINYYFELEDVVENVATSRTYEVKVDTTFPVVNNPTDFFEVVGGYVYFSIDITETNLDKAFYVDSRGYEKTICTRLYNGLCEKKISFRSGNYSLSIQIRDEAGNAIGIPTGEFEVKR